MMTTQNTRQNLEEEIKRLKNEVASLKKHHVTPPQHIIPVRRQILPVPPSKRSPQKIIHDSNKSKQKTCKLANLQKTNSKPSQIYSKNYENIANLRKAISRAARYRDDLDGNVINLSKHSFTKKKFKVLNTN